MPFQRTCAGLRHGRYERCEPEHPREQNSRPRECSISAKRVALGSHRQDTWNAAWQHLEELQRDARASVPPVTAPGQVSAASGEDGIGSLAGLSVESARGSVEMMARCTQVKARPLLATALDVLGTLLDESHTYGISTLQQRAADAFRAF